MCLYMSDQFFHLINTRKAQKGALFMKKVAVIMGSDSDLPVVKGAITRLKQFDVPFEVHVMSAHRTPAAAESFARTAEEQGFGVIIAAAGKAAHLGGVLAAYTTLPYFLLKFLFRV